MADRLKRTPLTDVSGMLRSFDYAAHAALFAQSERGLANAENLRWIAPWARFWTHWVSQIFLTAYHAGARGGDFLPTTGEAVTVLLEANLINKALYELRYELNNRPAWLQIPVRGLLHLMQAEEPEAAARAKAKTAALATA